MQACDQRCADSTTLSGVTGTSGQRKRHRIEFTLLTAFQLDDRRAQGLFSARVKRGWKDLLGVHPSNQVDADDVAPGWNLTEFESASQIAGCPQDGDLSTLADGVG